MAPSLRGRRVSRPVRDFLHAPPINCEKKGLDWFLSEEKRHFDRELCKVLAPLFLPVLTAAASLAVLEDGGPPFFTQKRVGMHGELFDMHKVRSQFSTCGTGPSAGQDDPNNTMIGRLIRLPIIDEYVQLWDIWEGRMTWCASRSLVPGEISRTIFPDEEPVREGELDLVMEEVLGSRKFRAWYWDGYSQRPSGLVSPFGNVSVHIPKDPAYFQLRADLDIPYFKNGCLKWDLELLETKLINSVGAVERVFLGPLGLA
jgi:hypothetical protein